MSDAVQCVRCGRAEAPALEQQVYPGPTGAEIESKVCADCWQEWERMEVIVINELRLNFMSPESQSRLEREMREFLGLGERDRTAES